MHKNTCITVHVHINTFIKKSKYVPILSKALVKHVYKVSVLSNLCLENKSVLS